MSSRRYLGLLLTLAAALAFAPSLFGQSLTTGAISGVVTDPSGAVVQAVTITAKNLETGAVLTTMTMEDGAYRFTLLKPSRYEISVNLSGFAPLVQTVGVVVGQMTTADLKLTIMKGASTIEVTASAVPMVVTNPGVNTTFTQTEVQQLPSPGGDITNIAQTAPGTVMNSAGGYGNFTTYGLPATSNLFTVNGENDMDPYFNINNTGATNLTLGSNEVQEVTVTSNAYAGQYGQLAGAQVTMITKSGSNTFHGNAQYWWNGRAMNANNWMLNNAGEDRPFSNANQWAASAGGPIIKDKTFFFADTEGMRFILPNVFSITAPTAEFASAVVANVQNLHPNEAATYQKMFDLFAGAPGASSATPLSNSSYCRGLTLPGFDPATQHCSQTFQSSSGMLGKEWILAGRVDQKISNNDNAYFRYKSDRGVQPTYLDPINSNFNALSSQPSWDAQANEIHIFGPHVTNSFMATLSHYTALFQQDEQKALSTFPYDTIFSTSVPYTRFGDMINFPQGRNITQYQFIDDLAWSRGKHNFKFGANFRRYDISDHNFFINNPGVYFGYTTDGMQKFVDGVAYQYRRTLNASSNVPIAMWGLGLYAQDEWNVSSHLKLTFALRAEQNSNPVCQQNCFANFVSPWSSLPSYAAGANAGDVPYKLDILSGLHQAYPGTDAINWAPRLGFSWSPRSSNDLVISGGFGLFYDNPAASLVDDLLSNPPIAVQLRVRPSAGTLAFDTTSTGSAATWQASANAFSSGFAGGQTFSQIRSNLSSMGVAFAAPAFTAITGTIHSPLWKEWNLQIQKQFGPSTVFTVNYVGNRGGGLPYTNAWPNSWDAYGIYNGLIPTDVPVPNYGVVSIDQSGAISNYNGLTFSLKERFSNWFTAHLNYTWSHNLDEISNGGLSYYSYAQSIMTQICPESLRACNYGNSDYDIRHLASADYVINPEFHFESALARHALNGWQLSGKIFLRSGLPFSVYDGNSNGAYNGNASIMAMPVGGVAGQTSCGRQNASAAGSATGCLNASAFVDTSASSWPGYTFFQGGARNQFHGPNFFDTDMSLFKTFRIAEKVKLGVGLTAYNAFNHPNFYVPDSTLGSSTFGQISEMTPLATSPYGSFLGFDSSPRVVQLTAKFEF